MESIYRFFKLRENATSIKIEAMAGFTTFLCMLYIIPVGALILSDSGMPKDALVSAITIITMIATIMTGLWANVPVAMSVGMGLNAYFSYGLVQGMGLSWQEALGAVFISGVIFVIVSVTKIRVWLINSIPKDLRYALCGGLGAFIATIGLKSLGIVEVSSVGLLSLGDITSQSALFGIFGIFVMIALSVRGVSGAFILGIFLTSVLAWIFGVSPLPSGIFSTPSSIAPIAMKLDIIGALNIALLPAIISLLITDLFDSLGTLAGVGAKVGMFKNGDKALEKTLEVDAVATVVGSIVGVSTTTSFLESASGVSAGGRTGLSAIFCALFFGVALFMLPLFLSIPSFAIYPTLVVVGALMFVEIKNIDFYDLPVGIASFFTILVMPLTYSIADGLAAGFIIYILSCLFSSQYSRINSGVLVLGAISLIPFISHAIR